MAQREAPLSWRCPHILPEGGGTRRKPPRCGGGHRCLPKVGWAPGRCSPPPLPPQGLAQGPGRPPPSQVVLHPCSLPPHLPTAHGRDKHAPSQMSPSGWAFPPWPQPGLSRPASQEGPLVRQPCGSPFTPPTHPVRLPAAPAAPVLTDLGRDASSVPTSVCCGLFVVVTSPHGPRTGRKSGQGWVAVVGPGFILAGGAHPRRCTDTDTDTDTPSLSPGAREPGDLHCVSPAVSSRSRWFPGQRLPRPMGGTCGLV